MYDNRKFMIFDVSELSAIDFSEVLEFSPETIRKSINGNKTFVKWDTEEIPLSVNNLLTKEGPYTYDEMLDILSLPEWASEIIPTNFFEI